MKKLIAILFVLTMSAVADAGPRGCSNGQCAVPSVRAASNVRVRVVQRVRSFRLFRGRCR